LGALELRKILRHDRLQPVLVKVRFGLRMRLQQVSSRKLVRVTYPKAFAFEIGPQVNGGFGQNGEWETACIRIP
jgi:hypothetical protein